MSYLAKKFVLFLGALGVLLGSVFISFRCGYSSGLEDAPRHFYSVDVARSLKTNPAFKSYVDSLFVREYRSAIDSIVRTDEVLGVIGKWLDDHPGCAMQGASTVPGFSKREYDNVFFMKVK